jgi:hypothetical protein
MTGRGLCPIGISVQPVPHDLRRPARQHRNTERARDALDLVDEHADDQRGLVGILTQDRAHNIEFSGGFPAALRNRLRAPASAYGGE